MDDLILRGLLFSARPYLPLRRSFSIFAIETASLSFIRVSFVTLSFVTLSFVTLSLTSLRVASLADVFLVPGALFRGRTF